MFTSLCGDTGCTFSKCTGSGHCATMGELASGVAKPASNDVIFVRRAYSNFLAFGCQMGCAWPVFENSYGRFLEYVKLFSSGKHSYRYKLYQKIIY